MSPLKVAIIGSGPAGCTLARILVRESNIQVTVFEAESSVDTRAQGGTLDLHTDTGLAALKRAGLFDEFLKYARFDGEALVICDKKMKKYLNLKGTTSTKNSRGRPEIDRVQLRLILLESLPKDIIRWGSRLQSVDDDLCLHFEHGVEKGFDLVVGADGAWSKVRPLVSSEQPFYSEIGGMDLFIANAEERYPDLHKIVNKGSVFGYSDGKALIGQQKGDRSLIVYAWSVRDHDWKKTCGYDLQDAKAVKQAIAKEYSDWAPKLLKLAEVANEDDMIARNLYMLPVGHRWKNRPGVTLLGDAAHLMTPFAGEGVNLAMKDAVSLADAVLAANKDGAMATLTKEVKAFEEDMFVRATKTQARTKANMDLMFFTPGAPRTSIENYIIEAVTDDMNVLAGYCVAVLVRSYFWIWKIFN
ncbi:hypothetical protein MMC11_000420 [Xylographa trunciseda]|nr:hypothetical protein [Xylographa trunciseda]